jgi:hypothetical protein
VQVLDDRSLGQHEPLDPIEWDSAVAAGPRHLGVDLGDHGARRERRCLRHVDRDAEAARSVRIGRGDLHESHVERNPAGSKQPRHIG